MLEVKCDKCGADFELDVTDLIEATDVIDGVKLTATYFTCRECKETYLVQLDDEQSLKKLEEEKRLRKRHRFLAKNNKVMHQKQTNKMNQLIKELIHTRTLLKDKYWASFDLNIDGKKPQELN